MRLRHDAMMRALGATLLAALAGCATITEPLRSNLSSASPTVLACSSWYEALDRTVDESRVRDAGTYRVPGFPYLRVDRVLASFRGAVGADPAAYTEWVRRLRMLDATARAYEIGNLPGDAVAALGAASREEALAKTAGCAAELQRADLERSENRDRLAAAAVVPDEYLEWQRMIGLYALTRIPFGQGVERWHREAREMFERSKGGAAPAKPVVRYGSAVPPVSRDVVARLLARGERLPLGMQNFSAQELDLLFSAYAPVFEIETGGTYDHPGALSWKDGAAPSIDSARPVVYRRLAYTRHTGRTLVQLVYMVWFSERPSDSEFDLLAGRLDGVVWRVTLAPDGEPLVFDTMHSCGCFHMFFPTPLVSTVPAPDPSEEWAFVPAMLPRVASGERVRVRIATRTHYVIDAGIDGGGAFRPYGYLEDDDLRSIAAPGGNRSAFGPNGLVPGTERGERVFFWPMGIPSSGAMRQWGKHATAFIGRRHFDDADLIERRFRIGAE